MSQAIDLEVVPRSRCSGCKTHRFGVRGCAMGDGTIRDLCRRCRVALGGEVVAPEAPTLPYVVPDEEPVCVCGPSPTHAGFCPVAGGGGAA